MGCFKLLKRLVQELIGLISEFWCGNSGEKKGIHWMS